MKGEQTEKADENDERKKDRDIERRVLYQDVATFTSRKYISFVLPRMTLN